MQIILLAAGSSSRMAPISDKTLFKLSWKCVIEHQIDTIISAWFDDFLIVCNESNIDSFKEIWKSKQGINFDFVIQEVLNDWMKWAIDSCGKKSKEKVFVISSNDIVEKDIFERMLAESRNNDSYWVVCGKVVDNYFPWGYISKDNNNNLIDIVEKPGELNEPSNQINLVLHIWNNFNDFKQKRSYANWSEFLERFILFIFFGFLSCRLYIIWNFCE